MNHQAFQRFLKPQSIAVRLGYPVALKAQAAALTHKTEAGGVTLNIADEPALRLAWTRLRENVKRAAPGVKLEGALVERMAAHGRSDRQADDYGA